ncbi:MAG: N-acetyltransferase family protein [Nocardioides sp.]
MLVRPANAQDLPEVAAIYAHEAATGIATFDTVGKPVAAWAERLASAEVGDHLLVAEEHGVVAGYAASGAWRPRPAYARTRETSVYLSPAARGRCVGRLLYDDLLARLRGDGVRLVVAVVALPNDPSLALHRSCGFTEVGVLHDVGRKFDRWIDTALLELRSAGAP